jgi:hypothetical protein
MAKKKAAKKKAGRRKVVRKKIIRRRIAKRAATTKEKERPTVRIVRGTWKAVPRSKPRIRGRLLAWMNEDSQDLSVVFAPGVWPFSDPADATFADPNSGNTVHVVHVDGDKPSGWFTVGQNAPKVEHGYNITPRGQEVAPKNPPGPGVTPADP